MTARRLTIGLGIAATSFATIPAVVAVGVAPDDGAAPPADRWVLGDRLWIDVDRSGAFDTGEPPAPDGIVVDLLTGVGEPVLGVDGAPVTVVSTGGRYLFDDLPAGEYMVRLGARNFARGSVLSFYAPTMGAATSANPGDGVDDDNNGVAGPSGSISTGVVAIGAGTPAGGDVTVDIGLIQRLSIGDVLWQDLDNNGRLEVGEPPIADVVVELLDPAGAVIANTITDLGGKYRFDDLRPGTYRVRVPAANFRAGRVLDTFSASTGQFANQNEGIEGNSDGRVGTNGVESGIVTLADGTEGRDNGSFDSSVDFGFYSLNVASTVWSDDDRDGFRDAFERGIPGVTGRLLDGSGAPVLDPFTGVPIEAVTGADGVLSFRGLAEGDYIVELPNENFVPGNTLHDFVSSAIVTLSADGGTDDDNNGVLVDGRVRSGAFRLQAGTERLRRGTLEDTVDFGMVKLAAVGGRVWRDDDRDGREDEPGVAGVVVELIRGGQVYATTTTDVGGNYLFPSLQPGTYSIRFVTSSLPAGFVTTLVDVGGDDLDSDELDSDAGPDGLVLDIVLATGQVDRTIDLGVYQGPIGGLTPLLPATGATPGLAALAGGLTVLGLALRAIADRRRPAVR
ncbi:MAG: SdrD B-like domain-containing protein [Ilumatobacteraceae bacterium]